MKLTRREFNVGASSCLLGTSFLTLPSAEPKKPANPLEGSFLASDGFIASIEGKPGSHCFAALVDNERTFAAYYHPSWPVWEWWERINYYIDHNLRQNAIDNGSQRIVYFENHQLVWTDHWCCRPDGHALHEKLDAHLPVNTPMIDKWENIIHWQPNSHLFEITPAHHATTIMLKKGSLLAEAELFPHYLMGKLQPEYKNKTTKYFSRTDIPCPCGVLERS